MNHAPAVAPGPPRTPPRWRRPVVVATVCALVGVALAACGSSADTTATDASTTSTPASSTANTGDAGTAPAAPVTSKAPGSTVKGGASTTTASGKGTPGTSAATTTTPGTDPGTLPQTEAKPTASGPQWDADVAGLWDAIVTDDVAKARPFFFPLSAYKQVKAISDPAGDYDKRLIAYYEQDIHALHKQLGANAAKATFVKLDVPSANAQWIKPGVEYNKGAYWRVFDSKLVYTVDGKQSSMLVKSMISWRGEWYVVHLSSVR